MKAFHLCIRCKWLNDSIEVFLCIQKTTMCCNETQNVSFFFFCVEKSWMGEFLTCPFYSSWNFKQFIKLLFKCIVIWSLLLLNLIFLTFYSSQFCLLLCIGKLEIEVVLIRSSIWKLTIEFNFFCQPWSMAHFLRSLQIFLNETAFRLFLNCISSGLMHTTINLIFQTNSLTYCC